MDPAQILANFGKTPVTSVTAISDQDWWVSNASTIVATSDGGRSFTMAYHDIDPGFCGCQFTAIRFVDPEHGTALLQSQDLRSTSDGGKSWKPIAVHGASSFFALEAGGTKTTYALQHNADNGIHLWRQVGTGAWGDIATLPGITTPGPQDVQLTVQGNKALVIWRTSSAVVSASYDSDGNRTGPKPIAACDVSLGLSSSSSGLDSVWLSCQTGTADTVLWTTDLGTTWYQVPLSVPASRHVVGAIQGPQGMISTSDSTLARVASNGTAKNSPVPSSATSGWTYLGFTGISQGFALTGDGQLLRSTDQGGSWHTVSYPG